MGQQVGTPRVQDGEEPDFCTEAFGISSDFEQGPGSWRRITGRGNGLREVSAKGFSSRGVR